MQAARKLAEKTVYRTRRFDVVESKLRIRDKIIKKPFIRHNGFAEILPIEGGSVVMIREYRHGINRYVYEIPSGTLKNGERPIDGARRELIEEAGIAASRLRHMFSGYHMLGYSSGESHYFLATGLRKVGQRLEDDEEIDVVRIRIGKLVKMIEKGKIGDLSVTTALFYYLKNKSRLSAR